MGRCRQGAETPKRQRPSLRPYAQGGVAPHRLTLLHLSVQAEQGGADIPGD